MINRYRTGMYRNQWTQHVPRVRIRRDAHRWYVSADAMGRRQWVGIEPRWHDTGL